MIGLTALALLGVWIWLATKVGRSLALRLKAGRWQPLVVLATVAAFLVLPVTDEIIGGIQFRALCKENASEFRMGVKNPEGRTTEVSIDPSNRYLERTAIPIRHSRITYRDISTGEVVVAYDSYVAEGGRFVGTIWTRDKPITLTNSTCSPLREEGPKLTFKFNVIN